jgi:hypothetical protein
MIMILPPARAPTVVAAGSDVYKIHEPTGTCERHFFASVEASVCRQIWLEHVANQQQQWSRNRDGISDSYPMLPN